MSTNPHTHTHTAVLQAGLGSSKLIRSSLSPTGSVFSLGFTARAELCVCVCGCLFPLKPLSPSPSISLYPLYSLFPNDTI